MDLQVLGGKLLLSVLGIIAPLLLIPPLTSPRVSNRKFDLIAFLILLFCRAALFIGIVWILNVPPTSDITGYYTEAKEALDGKMPLRDIKTAYGPLFNYTEALPLLAWDSPYAIVLETILFELASLPIWIAVARKMASERIVRIGTILYVSCPLVLFNVASTGQNHVWISFFLALSFWLLLRKHPFLSGFELGASVVIVKFFSLLFMPVLGMAALIGFGAVTRDRWDWRSAIFWALGFAILPVICYGYVIAHGVNPLEQVAFHASYNSSGNLPYALSAAKLDFDLPSMRKLANIAGLVLLGTVFWVAIFKGAVRRPLGAMMLCAIVVFVVLIVSKKAFTSYMEHCLFPICIGVAAATKSRKAWIVFGCFFALAVLEPSLWYRWMHQEDFRVLWNPFPRGMDYFGARPEPIVTCQAVIFLLCEIALLLGYVLYARLLWKPMLTPDPDVLPAAD